MITLGKYALFETLGHGGYGTVYHARDTSKDVERAVKVLHPRPFAGSAYPVHSIMI
jgi:serine/threonine protein kinase